MKNGVSDDLLITDLVKRAVTMAVPEVIAALAHQQKPAARLLSIDEAAAYIGASRRQMQEMLHTGEIPKVGRGRLVRVDRRDLEFWIEQNKR